MKILQLIEELKRTHAQVGDLEVTCTVSLIADGCDMYGDPDCDIPLSYESTVKTLILEESKTLGKHIRVYE